MAMAFEAGARVADLEFVQFHPTVLSVAGAPRFLLSEALRGEGGRLLNAQGEAFVQRVDPAGDLAPRDVVARAIAAEMAAHGCAGVPLARSTSIPAFIHARFPTISAACRDAGLDLARDPIPVSPAAHYMMGGVETDLEGRTSVPNLFAAGEVASTGVHGANRLASNSLLEGLVFGARAARAMQEATGPAVLTASDAPALEVGRGGATSLPTAAQVQDVMWQHAGLSRTEAGLRDCQGASRGMVARCVAGPRPASLRSRAASRRQPGDRGPAGDARRAAAPREPRRPLSSGFPATRRSTLAEAHRRRATGRCRLRQHRDSQNVTFRDHGLSSVSAFLPSAFRPCALDS